MKKIKTLKTAFLFLVIATIPFLNSCSDESEMSEIEAQESSFLGKFTKEITIYDTAKANSVTLEVGSNDASVLDLWSEESFELNILSKSEEVIELNPGDENNASDDDTNDDVGAEISYRIIRKNIVDTNKRLILTENPPYSDDVRGWKYSTYYSEAIDGNTVTVNIFGHNFWKRGYYSVSYKKTSSSGWSTIAGEWTRIKRNETKSFTRTPCYHMKARRKYKGSNNSVTIEFEY
ncbi:hypothetical protein [Tenacibaculum jejuense]|uniref:Lipoprotein n=1 Tax=Tenacibaculum jejuense TaxID=584609 RepID=A0A238U9T3_9FLAO|nr:hypothetical protein [Tenacibaculum jejuense]SNR15224.1 exported protein of unknown function [Tenacibaculum jejuense]